MKIIKFQTEDFLPSLAMVNTVVLAKNTLPILSDVRIETKDDGQGGVYAELMTSDSETWLQMKAPLAEAEVGIVICIEAKGLLQALRNLGGKPVTMEIDDSKHIVKCDYGNGHFSLPYEDAQDFPLPNTSFVDPITNESNAKTKLMDAKKMLTAIEKAGFATANDELRPVMNGVRFEFFADGMVAVASDGHKLAKYKDLTITYDNSEDQTIYGFTMPKKPCSTLLNVLGSTVAGDIKVMFNDRCFTVNNTQFKMSARLIEGRYPNYDSVIPKDNDRIVTIAKNDFVAALKRVLPMGNANSELVALSFSMGMMTISAEDFDFSKSASENVGCDYAQEEFTIGFKGSTLLQLLQNIDTDNVKVMLKDPSRAGVLCENKPNGVYEYTSLIMPMLIQND